jgi:hypothetical protein
MPLNLAHVTIVDGLCGGGTARSSPQLANWRLRAGGAALPATAVLPVSCWRLPPTLSGNADRHGAGTGRALRFRSAGSELHALELIADERIIVPQITFSALVTMHAIAANGFSIASPGRLAHGEGRSPEPIRCQASIVEGPVWRKTGYGKSAGSEHRLTPIKRRGSFPRQVRASLNNSPRAQQCRHRSE